MVALAAGVGAATLALAGCGGSNDPDPDSSGTTSDSFTIGVAVIVDHPSLQLIRDGLADYLAEQGVQVRYIDENAQGETSNAAAIAASFASNDQLDLIVAISTPIAQAIVQMERDRPIVFAGVTDPVSTGLVPSWEASGTNVTGTSDLNPNAKPIGLIHEVLPDATTIGVLYSSSEANSGVQVEAYKAEAAELGLTIRESAITNSSEIASGIQALADVDAVIVPTDNTVVAAFATVIAFGQQNQLPIFSADAESVSQGTIATRGISYYELGRHTGEMAHRILVQGVAPGTIPPLVVQETELKVNPESAELMGVTLSQSLLRDATVVS
jgi:putative ABC transport system substrate-binding protein